MAGKEKTVFDIRELYRRLKLDQKERTISRQMGVHRDTIKKYRELGEQHGWLASGTDLPTPEAISEALQKISPPINPFEVSSVEPFRELVETLLKDKGMLMTVVHQRLLGQGYTGGYSSVRRFVSKLRGPTMPEGFCRIEVAPGTEAQVDFGYVGMLYDPLKKKERRGWVFMMTLSYSRHMFVEIVFDQSSTTWLCLHQDAFEFFGGVPKTIVLDNLKAAIVKASVHDPVVQRGYRDLAEYYGFMVDPNRPRTPRHKGKVERSIRYLKQNFLPGRVFRDIADANDQLRQWNQEIAGLRMHGTTGWRPLEQFETVEQSTLISLPSERWEPSIWTKLTLHSDCYLYAEKSFYSAPFRFIEQELVVQISPHSVRIFRDLELVATHPRALTPKSRVFNEDHFPPHKIALLKSTPQWCLKKAEEIGPATLEWMQKYLSDRVMVRMRSGFAVLKFADKYTPQRLEKACRRALDFDEIGVNCVKQILARGLDQEPWTHLLPQTALPPATVIPLPQPRYARDSGHFFQPHLEVQ